MVNVFNEVLSTKSIVKLGFYVKQGSLYLIVNPNVAKVGDATDPRRQG